MNSDSVLSRSSGQADRGLSVGIGVSTKEKGRVEIS
jgi:hypothetical protein